MTLEFDLPVFAKPDDFFELSSRLYNHADTFTVSQRQQLRPILESIIIKFESTLYLRPILKNLLRFLNEEIMPFCTEDYFYQPEDESDYCSSVASMPEPMTVIEEVDDEDEYEEDSYLDVHTFPTNVELVDVELPPIRMRRSAPLNFDTLSVVSECPSLLSNSLPLEEKTFSTSSEVVLPDSPSKVSQVIELPVDEAPPTSTCSESLPPSPLPSPNPSDLVEPVKPVTIGAEKLPIQPPSNELQSTEFKEPVAAYTMNAGGDHATAVFSDDEISPFEEVEVDVDVDADLEPQPMVKKRSFRKNVSRLVNRVSKVFRSKHKSLPVESEAHFSSS